MSPSSEGLKGAAFDADAKKDLEAILEERPELIGPLVERLHEIVNPGLAAADRRRDAAEAPTKSNTRRGT